MEWAQWSNELPKKKVLLLELKPTFSLPSNSDFSQVTRERYREASLSPRHIYLSCANEQGYRASSAVGFGLLCTVTSPWQRQGRKDLLWGDCHDPKWAHLSMQLTGIEKYLPQQEALPDKVGMGQVKVSLPTWSSMVSNSEPVGTPQW